MVWQVSALVAAIAQHLQARFGAVAVKGEITGFARAASGHCYFSLKDEAGQLRCAMFRRAAGLLDFAPRDGDQVEVRGRVSVFEGRGELQLVVEAMRRAGQGTLFERFLQLKAKLEAEGLFDVARKRPLPPTPRAIAVITSLQAAALRDVLSVLARRSPHVQAWVVPSAVQGAEAPAALVKALGEAGHLPVEAVLLVRGGGSLEDLWAFNDEVVVRKVAQCPVPVVCGVGHESDFTLCDFAADVRVATPTAAAELVTPATVDLLAGVQQAGERLARAQQRLLERHAQRLDAAQWRLRTPQAVLQRLGDQLSRRGERVRAALARTLERRRSELNALARQLVVIAPQRVLERGYALLTTPSGALVRSVAQLAPGQPFQAQLADGQVGAVAREGRIATPDTESS
jgi:exodeoxyribonuclease VII large subunit